MLASFLALLLAGTCGLAIARVRQRAEIRARQAGMFDGLWDEIERGA